MLKFGNIESLTNKGSYAIYRGTHKGKLYDEYHDVSDYSTRPNGYTSRPKLWKQKLPDNGFFLTQKDNDLILHNSEKTIYCKFIGYITWPITNANMNFALNKTFSPLLAKVYELDHDYAFAGGKFIVSPDGKNAEMIIYGSGRYIIEWESGIIKKFE